MVTQAEIAKKLGVSRQLVTFALAGYPHVAEESRIRILKTATEMGYRPNPHARALKKKRTGILGLWIPDQISTHYSHVSRELSHLVKEAGQELIISEIVSGDAKQLISNLSVDGIFVVDASKEIQRELAAVVAKSVPVVSIGAHSALKIDSVLVDLKTGTMEAMAHLISSGYRRIAHATFVKRSEPHENRRIEYTRAMREAGLKPEFFYYPLSGGQRSIARQMIQDYIRNHGVPEAIFCHSDDVTLGIYRGLCDMGIRVPEQVALVGCDGIQDTEYLEVPLTTLVQPVVEMCSTAWRFLLHRMGDSTLPLQHALLTPSLAIRESSRRVAP
ncbi:MAG: LacI family DNA-binding transcriptional regulator [Luteolibacter sp.]|uniref:LacI family DNA-binding transcriptional regulator n=1 Tax=Luteolibacter sp. TaxID=1962973 RepID=UPI003262CE09